MLDAKHLGLGGASCGPRPMAKYLLRSKPFSFRYVLRPWTRSAGRPDDLAVEFPPLPSKVSLSRDADGKLSASCSAPGVKIMVKAGKNAAEEVYVKPIDFMRGGVVSAWAEYPAEYLVRKSKVVTRHFPMIVDRSGWKVVSVDSFQADEGEGEHVFDGKPYTYWHTEWKKVAPDYPHEIVIDFGEELNVSGLKYLARQDNSNGRIAEYEIYVSSNGSDWGSAVKQGKFQDSDKLQLAKFAKPVKCKFIKLRAVSEIKNNKWASAAEINVECLSE
jgi:beta-galactosidase